MHTEGTMQGTAMESSVLLLKDLARLSGHSIHTLKFYLKLGLITETGRSPETRFRYFNGGTVRRLERIRSLQKEGLRLAAIGRRLEEEEA